MRDPELDEEADPEDDTTPSADELPGILRLVVRTSQPSMGAPVVSGDGLVELTVVGGGDSEDLALLLDGEPLAVQWSLGEDGLFRASTKLDDLSREGHELRLRDRSGDQDRTTTVTLVVPSDDEHLGEEGEPHLFPTELPEEEDDGSEDWSTIRLPRRFRWKGGSLDG